uniref:Gustatory receptor family protein 3-like isoform X2 n=1 Tax=Diabrotica virgifera virgifera TaxID=50390 RepID=A0A6P7F644_DIAVI
MTTFNLTQLLINSTLVIGLMVWPVLVIFACEWMTSESQKLVVLCYELQENFPVFSEEKQALLNLANHVQVTKPTITAGGFFELNCKLIFGLFGTITTYFFIIMQFNSAMDN